jgi:hypothetical protein
MLPYIRYWHRFQASNTDLIIDIPRRMAVRQQLAGKTWLTLGSEVSGTVSFFDFDQYNQANFPQKNIYSTTELRTRLSFEWLVFRYFVLGSSVGFFSTENAQMFDRTKSPSDYYLSGTYRSAPYVNCTLSVLPFNFHKRRN